MKLKLSRKQKNGYFINTLRYKSKSPLRLVFTITILIFITEAIVMAVIYLLPPSSFWMETLIDSSLLITLLSPLLYFLLFRSLVSNIEQRKQTEKALSESESRIRALINASADAILLIDSWFRVLIINEAAAKIMGQPSNSLIGKNIMEMMPPELSKTRMSATKKVFDSGKYIRFEDQQLGRWFDQMIYPIIGSSGKVMSAAIIARDITERKLVEEEHKKLLHEKGERVKELQCMYGVAESIRTRTTLDEIFQDVAELIPPGWHYPEITRGKVIFDRKEYFSEPFAETGWKQSSDIIVNGEPRGSIEVYYLKECPELDEGPFMREERNLINGMAKNISEAIERKLVEETLRKNQQLIQGIIDNSTAVICVKDIKGQYILVNRQYETLFNIDPEKIIGKTANDIFSKEEANAFQKNYETVLKKGIPLESEDSATLSDGPHTYLSINFPLLDATGKPYAIASISTDITERKRAEEEIKESEEKFKAVTQSASDAIVSINESGEIFFWNKSADTMFGYSNEEIIGKSLQLIIPNRFWQGHKSGLKRFRETREPKVIGKTVELIGRKKDGNEFPIELSISNWDMKDEICYSGIIRDISERKQIERAMHQAKLEAEKAASVKAEFLANMSHEIRTPMNGVIGMTGLLLDTELNAEQKDCVETIRASGDALLTIINDILDFSKIESGNLLLEMQSFYLHDSIEESFDFLASKAAQKNLEMAYDFENNVPEVIIGDITRLRQILINLLGNAIKYTEEGEIAVTVNAEEKEDGKYKIHFAVRDTGIGIPKDRMNKLFQSFSQVDTSTTRRFGGTGLGLAISKRLSEIMGGTVWAESELGKGSVFNFTIQAELGEEPKREYMIGPFPVLRKKKVLIVDDNETNRKLISYLVDKWEMDSVAVSSGLQALELIRGGESFDVALIDMHMPNMNGIMLSAEIRRYCKRDELPLVMLTSIDRRKEDLKIISDYFSAYLLKPIKQSQLYNAIISVFKEAKEEHVPGKRETQFDSELAQRYPLRVLLADDNVINQKVAERMLQRMGYRPDIVSNGLEVLQALENVPYDLLFIDVHMPEMDGLDATRRICKQYSREERPLIVAMTADVMKGDMEKCLAAGMDDYIGKPIKVPELIRALERAASNKLTEGRRAKYLKT